MATPTHRRWGSRLTISTCREYKPMALVGKVKPCPLHSHPVQAGCRFTAKPLIYAVKVGSRSGHRRYALSLLRFRRLSANPSQILSSCSGGGFPLGCSLRLAVCPRSAWGGVLLGAPLCSAVCVPLCSVLLLALIMHKKMQNVTLSKNFFKKINILINGLYLLCIGSK